MSNLTKFRFQRGQFKATLTRFKGYINSIDLDNIDEITITQLKVRLDKIKPILNEFSSVQASIEYELSGSENQEQELQQELNELINFEKSYFELISFTQNLINNSELNDGVSSISANKNSVNSSVQSHFKLPDIKLPIFRGSFETWLEFRDTYYSLVHHNANISNIQKFYYLKSCLEGEPSKLISSVEVSESNYTVAWSLIKDRYENKKLIVHNYIKGLFDSPVVVKESHAELRNLHDNFVKNLRSLKVSGQPTDSWDALLVYMLCTKLDNITRREWESYRTKGELPTVNELLEFLKQKCEVLEKLEITKNDVKTIEKQFSKFPYNKSNRTEKTRSFNTTTERKLTCYFCKKEHSIYQCEKFRELDIPARIDQVKMLKLCTNCFDPNHINNDCKRSNCRICKKRHNTLLHLNSKSDAKENVNNANSKESTSGTYMTSTQEGEGIAYDRDSNTSVRRNSAGADKIARSASSRAYNVAGINNLEDNSQPLLSTAVIRVHGKNNRFLYARVLLDAGSQSHFMSEKLAKQLDLDKKPVNYSIVGVGESKVLAAQYKTDVRFSSRINDYTKNISCLIIPKIAQKLPNASFKVSPRSRINELTLADPNYNLPQDIDMLLGVSIFYDILIMEQRKNNNMPILQNTQLGWVFGGNIPSVESKTSKTISCITINESLENALTKFWTVEECDNERILTKDEIFCEEHFLDNVKRTPEGRFIVKFPFKENVIKLGHSDEMALNRFHALERRLNRDKVLKNDYCDFMKEYIELGHMRKLEVFDINKKCLDGYFLPHHAVIKNTSITIRTRIVFDASAKSDNGISLNDVQYVGPTLQDDLFSILLRFRQHKFVLNADISKMYRQILIDPSERKYLRIFWRDNDGEQIQCYELNTVTYGTSSAPYLAVRCLRQMGIENNDEYPIASKVILKDFYIDDLLTGSDSPSELREIQRDVTNILRSGGFQLRKWLCNNKELLKEINVDENLSSGILHLGKEENNKTLGIYWNAFNDNIQYSIKDFEVVERLSKRIILSMTSQIFDPLGLVGPIVVIAKMFLQRLWQEKLDWDQQVSNHLSVTWNDFCKELLLLNNLKIPRYVCCENYTIIEIHGFADASEKAYGACIYISCKVQDKPYKTQLLCSKSRVCPLKQISLPRLELCAAELLAKLMRKVG
ncbi:uncharacterized protein LOC123678716 [Harmonia axyridis]|uniref:uncharacterized protein LOC123678716 n=1 Tax=Harmonia axyridis TaxID=115357 RepID=UPI001E2782B8|nr:uncharacterized protein LOC123678716 [Harmonia axyridis]